MVIVTSTERKNWQIKNKELQTYLEKFEAPLTNANFYKAQDKVFLNVVFKYKGGEIKSQSLLFEFKLNNLTCLRAYG
jgi:hypothetical protein